ncbi:MAG: rod shape-determining protein MreD [Fibromonadaceae bacterium]|jgi:rod shape-determining protein MreD|nr:rod shape-determining protein MreD [Fibromonadaceae bacterium]
MLKFIIYFILFFFAALLQTVIAPRIAILGTEPSFLLILTVVVALRHGALAGCFLGFISGLFCDSYAPIEWLGAYSLSYCIIGFAVGQIKESFIDLNLLLKTLLLAVTDIIKDLLYLITIGEKGGEILHTIGYHSIPNSLYTISLGAIFFYLLSFGTEKKQRFS